MLYKSRFNNNFNFNVNLHLKLLNTRIQKIMSHKRKKVLFDYSLDNIHAEFYNNSKKLLKNKLRNLNVDIVNLKIENTFIRCYFRDFFKYYFFKIFLKSYMSRI